MPGYLTINVEGRGLLAKEINSINIPGRDGEYILDSKYPSREIKVYYYITADDHPEWLDRIQKLNEVLQVNKDVEFHFQDDNLFRYGRVVDTEDPPYDSHNGIGSFTIYCQDPWAYRIPRESEGLILSENNFPVKFEEISFKVTSSAKIIKITNTTTGKRIVLSGDFKYNDEVVLTNDKIIVNNRDRMSWLDPMASDYHNFELFSTNEVLIDYSKDVLIIYREKII